MPPLRINLSDLTRLQRQWTMFGGSAAAGFGGSAASGLGGSAAAGDGVLQEASGFGSNPGALRMLSYVPPALPAGAPLVVVLHGCTQTAAGFNAGTGWSTLAEQHGFALLMPEQRRSNNAQNCFNWFEPGDTTRGAGEVASIAQMVQRMLADHALDPARVHVTGLSAGGAMTAALLATYPELFAGGAIIAGLPFGAASGVREALAAMAHSRSLPAAAWGDLVRTASAHRGSTRWPTVAIWHGDADQTVSPRNALESAKQWTDVHGLSGAASVHDVVDGVQHQAWRGHDGAVRVELYAVPGLAHGAPITPRATGDAGVGAAMPFVLEAPISSTWHIARSWELLGTAPARRPASTAPAPSPAPADSAPATLANPRALIERTLRAAGLLGPG